MTWLRVGIVLALLSSLLTGAFLMGRLTVTAERDAADLAKKAGEEAALQATARAIAKIEVKSEKHIQPLLTEVRTNTVYVECKHSPDSLRNLNALITGDEDAGVDSLSQTQPTP
jgi:hypothetical protein